MASEAFPVFKLGILVFKQLSKPIANVIKDHAKESLFFRQYIAMPPAYFYNWMEVKIRMWSLNLGKPATIPQLNETMAIELGAKLLGEIILFTIPAAVLVFEYQRQSRRDAKKEEETIIEKLEMVNTVNNMALHLERQNVQLNKIRKTLAVLASKRWITRKNNSNETEYHLEDTPLHLRRLPIPGQ